jgi:hypothetical protein
MWPVEETGKNSVMPSTMPRMTARNESDSMIYRPLSRLVICTTATQFAPVMHIR